MLNSKSIKQIALLLVLSAGLLGVARLLWPHISEQQESQIAQRLIAEVELSSPSQSRILLRQIASLGDSTLDTLVMAATSKRSCVTQEARQIIEEKLGNWKTTFEVDPTFKLDRPTSILASTLATHISEFGPFGKQWASNLALELVVLADELPAKVAARLLADCSTIMEQVPALGPRMRTLDRDKIDKSIGEPQVSTGSSSELELPDIPSEYTISTKLAKPELEVAEIEKYETLPLETSAGLTSSPPSTLEWASNRPQEPLPKTPLAKPVIQQPGGTLVKERTIEAAPNANLVDSVIEVPAPNEMEAAIAAMHTESTRTLVERLPNADFYTAGAIRLVLRERGITEEVLSILDRLTSNDPADRLRLISDLKVLPARPARRWLRQLLDDKNAEVRLEALTALATTKDPDLVELAREMVVNDRDARVSELAARIMSEAK